ncbi:TonB-dependent receptor plug domain-containing protein [Zymomonas mobilis]|uniref:TonB-dependent receptor plug domain-containing protein n=1 Tax=Zymomonas mobilis TaxID=542 RepID=UPI000049A6DC|nr:TonB-dependent receptor plug domain-containing protein [Zymomonas mobilis]UBQ08007.1 TonB-dependent receptor plug domain-containing protein [Zymomonas mobilis]
MRKIAFSCCWLTLSSLLPGIALGATPSLEKAQTETTKADSVPEVTNKTTNGKEADKGADLVVTARQTHSEQSVSHVEIQRLLPGLNPVKAIAILPGVVFTNADPWGNNEQNSSLFIHGFSKNQLGYTMDGVPLGDQDYGNYNGLSPQRAMISENTKSASLSSGAGALGTASTSNLGGTLEFLTSDPLSRAGGQISQTFGSYSTYRTFARIDTGEFGDGNKAYVSWARQDAKAWDFNGHQGGNQVNAKFIHQDDSNKLTLYFDWSKKIEPNEDGVVMPSSIYVRPSMYPDFNYAQNYLSASGATPAAAGLNYRNYYSDAQREDFLGYIKFTHDFSDNVSWDNQFYYHHNAGVGVVAGPIQAAGLPALFEAYFPGQNLKSVFGNSGYATRTTEYLDNRGGLMSTLHYKTGKHSIEVGGWYERNDNTQARNWYALDVNSPSTPYQRPKNPLIRQYKNAFYTDTFVTHLQDTWRITHNLTLQAGFKSELVYRWEITDCSPPRLSFS